MIDNTEDIKIFLEIYKNQKEEIFKEIDEFFNYKRFSRTLDFHKYFTKKLSKMPNQCKNLESWLILKNDSFLNFIY